jgi:hypothetical protein
MTKSSSAPAASPHRLLPHQHIHTLLAAVFTPSSIGISNHKSYPQQPTDIIFNPEQAKFFHSPSPIISTICIGYQHPPIDLAQQPSYCRLVLLNHLDSYPKMVSKRCVDAKIDLQTQRANTQFRCQGVPVDLIVIDKDNGNSNTLVLTRAMCPDVTAKRYSHGTRGSSSVTHQIDENS